MNIITRGGGFSLKETFNYNDFTDHPRSIELTSKLNLQNKKISSLIYWNNNLYIYFQDVNDKQSIITIVVEDVFSICDDDFTRRENISSIQVRIQGTPISYFNKFVGTKDYLEVLISSEDKLPNYRIIGRSIVISDELIKNWLSYPL